MCDGRVVSVPLGDRQGAERGDREAHGGRGEGRALRGDHAARAQFVQAGLHRAAGDAEFTGGAEHSDLRLSVQEVQQAAVEMVQHGRTVQS